MDNSHANKLQPPRLLVNISVFEGAEVDDIRELGYIVAADFDKVLNLMIYKVYIFK